MLVELAASWSRVAAPPFSVVPLIAVLNQLFGAALLGRSGAGM
jgi:hypothetical protein